MGIWANYVAPYWRSWVVVLWPLIILPIPVVSATAAARCGYVILVMAAFWMTEAVPLAVTALIPVFAFPLLGILSTGECCIVYMKETNMMFLGGLTVAIAVEHCNLHKRIALFVILHVGQSPRSLMAGFMLTTMFLSMWISNTASTAMMVPIVDAILMELYANKPADEDDHTTDVDATIGAPHQSQIELVPTGSSAKEEQVSAVPAEEGASEVAIPAEDKKSSTPVKSKSDVPPVPVVGDIVPAPLDDDIVSQKNHMRRALLLGVAYSANVGGTGVITGTSPNLVLMDVIQANYGSATGLNFASWMLFNVPGMLICVLLAWVWLQFMFMGLCRKNSSIQKSTPEREASVKRLIKQKYNELGAMTHHEATVLTLFIILVILWLFRAPEFVPGWSAWFADAFENIEVDDATPAMLIVFMLFILPANLNFFRFFKSDNEDTPTSSPACMTWKVVQEKIPWGVVLLLGGGFAMAEGAEKSGLSEWLGKQMETLDFMPKEAIVLVVCLLTAMLTEVASNTATASILLPVLKEMAVNIEVNPLYLMLPAAVCCSYAFMLPVATPPNAIVFAAANMGSKDMMKAGFAMNVICVLVVTVMINTLGVALFDLQTFPDWANSTAKAISV